MHFPHLRDGNGMFVWITASPLFDKSGNRVGAIESVRDITDYKKAEQEKIHLESQLRQSQKMEAIGQVAGGIAHDFNNILTAIIGYSAILKSKIGENTPLQRYVSLINGAAGKAAKLTGDLLAFSRKKLINPQSVNMNDLLLGMKALLHRLITEDIHFSLTLSEEPVMTKVDPAQMEQVIMNLVANACDAMTDGGYLNISTASVGLNGNSQDIQLAPGRYVLITVSDTGTGIDEETKERIFEPFFTTKEVGKGTGLGLSIAFGIIAQHNGYITVYSEQDYGTTFKIYLPELLSSESMEPLETEIVASYPRGGNETILLAEDNQETRNVMQEILEAAGYAVIAAVDGIDALEKFKKLSHSIELVILDVIMPHKNGKEVLAEIHSVNPKVKHLFSSGYTAEIIHKKGMIDHNLNFISKPVTPNDFLLKVRDILDH